MGDIMVDYFGENVHEEIAEERERERLEKEKQSDFKPKFCVAFIDSDDDIFYIDYFVNEPTINDVINSYNNALTVGKKYGKSNEEIMKYRIKIFFVDDGGFIDDLDDPKPEGPENQVW
jgi:hypothetical protein